VKLSDDEIEEAFSRSATFVERYFTRSTVLCAFCLIESPNRVLKTLSAFHPRAQRTAFRRRDARQQSELPSQPKVAWQTRVPPTSAC
jgi:hypothetical protein